MEPPQRTAKLEDWRAFYERCPDAERLLDAMIQLEIAPRALARAAAACVHLVRDQISTDQELRFLDDVRGGTEALPRIELAAPSAEDDSARAARLALVRIARCVEGEREGLSEVPTLVADCAVRSSMECGIEFAERWAREKCASAIRSVISWEEFSRHIPAADRA